MNALAVFIGGGLGSLIRYFFSILFSAGNLPVSTLISNVISSLILGFIFSFFPLSFILGNPSTNLNLLLFCVLGIFHLKSKILKVEFDFTLKIIFLFFLIVFFSTSLSFIKSLYFEGYEYDNLIRLVKSISFFRFFLMLLIIHLLCKFDILNFKYFFISAAFASIFVALDIIFQYSFGFNILGLRTRTFYNTGFFGDEPIVGGFIQNFSFFSILFTAFIFKNNNYTRYILTTIVINILALGILFSYNRMPLILFLFGLVLLFLFNDKLKKIISISLVALVVLFTLAFSSDEMLINRYVSLHNHTIGQLLLLKDNSKQNNEIESVESTESSEGKFEEEQIQLKQQSSKIFGESHRARLIITALDIWSRNKIFGNGIKSFRIDCQKLFYKNPEYNITAFIEKSKKNRLCSNHPRNYYIEVLTETGIVGFSVMLIIAFLFCIFIFKNLKLFKGSEIVNFIILSATISLILEMFPLKSTGSVFTTNDTAYIILISSIILSYKNILRNKSFK